MVNLKIPDATHFKKYYKADNRDKLYYIHKTVPLIMLTKLKIDKHKTVDNC